MNKKLIASKISKHPLIRRLSEVVDKKTMARLIVEELVSEGDEEVDKYEYLINSANSLEDLQVIKGQFDKDTGVTRENQVALLDIYNTAKEHFQQDSDQGQPEDNEKTQQAGEEPDPVRDAAVVNKAITNATNVEELKSAQEKLKQYIIKYPGEKDRMVTLNKQLNAKFENITPNLEQALAAQEKFITVQLERLLGQTASLVKKYRSESTTEEEKETGEKIKQKYKEISQVITKFREELGDSKPEPKTADILKDTTNFLGMIENFIEDHIEREESIDTTEIAKETAETIVQDADEITEPEDVINIVDQELKQEIPTYSEFSQRQRQNLQQQVVQRLLPLLGNNVSSEVKDQVEQASSITTEPQEEDEQDADAIGVGDGEDKKVTQDQYSELKQKYSNTEYMQAVPDPDKEVVYKFISILLKDKLISEVASPMKKAGYTNEQIRSVMTQLTSEEKGTLRKLFKQEGTSLSKLLKMLKPDEDKNTDTDKSDETDEEDKEGGQSSKAEKDKPGEPSKDLYQIDDTIKDKFIKAADRFQKEFYNQRYRKNQAIILKSLIDAISEITDDGNLAMAYSDVEEEGTTETLQEADENVEANEKQVQQLKMDFRSLLSDINKTTKSLKEFEDVASKGSVLTDAYKKNFMELLASLQKTLFLVVRDMRNIIKKQPEAVQEAKEESEKMKTFRAVKKAYVNAVNGVIAIRELLDGETTEENPENVIGDTYQAVVGLSQYFPSINPFNKGAKTKQDYENYLDSFKAAVTSAKSSLGNVLNFVKQGETGEATINSTIRELKSFSAKIASIFGVESQFKDKVIEPNAEAAKDDPSIEASRAEVYDDEETDDTGNILPTGRPGSKVTQIAIDRLKLNIPLEFFENIGEYLKYSAEYDEPQEIESILLHYNGDNSTFAVKSGEDNLNLTLKEIRELYEELKTNQSHTPDSYESDEQYIKTQEFDKLVGKSGSGLDGMGDVWASEEDDSIDVGGLEIRSDFDSEPDFDSTGTAPESDEDATPEDSDDYNKRTEQRLEKTMKELNDMFFEGETEGTLERAEVEVLIKLKDFLNSPEELEEVKIPTRGFSDKEKYNAFLKLLSPEEKKALASAVEKISRTDKADSLSDWLHQEEDPEQSPETAPPPEEKKGFVDKIMSFFRTKFRSGKDEDEQEEDEDDQEDSREEQAKKAILKEYPKAKELIKGEPIQELAKFMDRFDYSHLPAPEDFKEEAKGYKHLAHFRDGFYDEDNKTRVNAIVNTLEKASLRNLVIAIEKIVETQREHNDSFHAGKLGSWIEKYDFPVGADEESVEEQIANKLKPLIREMLRRN